MTKSFSRHPDFALFMNKTFVQKHDRDTYENILITHLDHLNYLITEESLAN